MIYPAITVWQPWADGIAAGVKSAEFRYWTPPPRLVGKRIAIHSASRIPPHRELMALVAALSGDRTISPGLLKIITNWRDKMIHPGPLGAIVCTAILGEPAPANRWLRSQGHDPKAIDVDPGLFAWPLSDIRRLDPPIPAKGQQGVWSVDLDIQEDQS